MDQKLGAIDHRFNAIDQQFSAMDQKCAAYQAQMVTNIDKRFNMTENHTRNLEATMKSMEHQLGRLVANIPSPTNTLPSNTVNNPKNVSACFVVSSDQDYSVNTIVARYDSEEEFLETKEHL
ncbi:UNVERIFIED_CONTAM: hypothetical protein ITH36_24335, partial [Salmonella enterica subsp. enterica serovar Weltevreden]